MKLQQRVIELIVEEGPPIFDVRVPPAEPGVPGEIAHVYCRVERGKIVSKQQTARIVTCLLLLVDPDLPDEVRRFGLLLPGGHVADGIAQDARHVGSFLHPANGSPISVFEFPWTALDEEPAAEGPDVLAAIDAARAAEEPAP